MDNLAPPGRDPAVRARLQIHLCVLLWGFTSILGKLISLEALPLVWWRMLIVIAALALMPRVWRGIVGMAGSLRAAYAGVGVLVALHWLTFYGAIKLADASVAAVCLALATVFTALLEPWLARTRFSWRDVLLGIAVLPGVALVVGGVPREMRLGVGVGTVSALLVAVFGSLNKRLVNRGDALTVTALELAAGTLALTALVVGGVPREMRLGVGVGTVSALLVAVFGSLNKRLVHRGDALTVTALELAAGTLALTALAPLMPLIFPPLAGPLWALPDMRDTLLLLALALGCTLLPFSLSLVALRHMSAFAAQLAVNLEPVYAILLAVVLLGEQRELTPRFYAGVAIILGAVFVHPLLGRARAAPRTDVLTSEGEQVAE